MTSENSSPAVDANEEIFALIETLLGAERRLEELTTGEVDTVAGRDGRTFLLRRAQEQLRHSESGQQAGILNALPAHIALIDSQGIIVSVNEAWRRFAVANVLHAPGHGVGLNYLDICDLARGDFSAEAHQVASGIRSVLSGAEKSFSIRYPCNSPTEQRWFSLTVTPLANDCRNGAVVMHLNITERKRIEAALVEGELRYRSLFENMLEGYAYCQALFEEDQLQDFIYLEVNDAFERLTGLKDVVGKKVSEVIPGIRESNSEIFDVYGRVILTGKPERFETYLDGLGTWLSITVYSSDRTLFVAVFENITARKLAEAGLRESQETIALTLKATHFGHWALDLVTHKASRSLQHDQIFGYEEMQEDWSWERFLTHVLAEDRAEVDRQFQAAVAAKAEWNIECRILRAGGAVHWIWALGKVFTNTSGDAVRMLGIVSDITERKRAQAQRERLADMVEASPDFIGFADAKTTQIQYINKHGRRICGIGEDEELGMLKIGDVHPAWMKKRFAEVILPAAVRDGSWEGEGAFLHRNGREIPVSMVLMARKAANGEVDIFYTVSRDITERKNLEAQLLQAQKMEAIGTLAGGIAHDFNNILAAIVGYSEMAQRSISRDSRAQVQLEQVLIASARATGLVQQILTFSRLEEPELEALELQLIIDETLKLLRVSQPSTVEISQDIDATAPSVLGDATQIQQVIMNLCINAGQAMKERGGVIDVRLTSLDIDHDFASAHPDLKEGPHICLTVSDTGCGMDRATQERIFEPFFTTKAPGEGTGLGLAVVHGVIKNHGGAIVVISEPGVGTTFSIYLSAYDHLQAAVILKSAAVPRGNGEHILLVDDEEALVSLGKSMLEHLSYCVTTRTDSLEALAVFTSQPEDFDLVIIDVTMPHLNGADLATALLKIRPSLPVILVTGYSAVMTPERAKAIGVQELLFKPNTIQTLGEAIQRALRGIRKK